MIGLGISLWTRLSAVFGRGNKSGTNAGFSSGFSTGFGL